MSLREFVVGYQDEKGEVVASLETYYNNYVKPLNPIFKGTLGEDRTVLCFFKDHPDTDPSLGIMPHKRIKGAKLYHCFGCHKVGDIVQLHKYIQSDYYHRVITMERSAIEVAELFGIPITEYKEKVVSEFDDTLYMKTQVALTDMDNKYNTVSFRDELLNIRKAEGLLVQDKASLVNRALIKLIAVTKPDEEKVLKDGEYY